jgi:hypothetical protein
MNKILTITIAVVLIAGFFSAPAMGVSREDVMSSLTSSSTPHSIFDRLENYHAPDIPICPDGSCSDTSPIQEDTGDISASFSVTERIESRLASLSANSNPSPDDLFAERTQLPTPSDSRADSILLGRTGPDDLMSEEEACGIALSQIEACYSCPVQLEVTGARLGVGGRLYGTSNPCWHVAVSGDFTDKANCSQCWGYMDLNGNIGGYGCRSVGGSVVIDAVSGKVLMTGVFL